MIIFNTSSIGKGASFLYIETIAALFSGYIFWFIMTKFSTSEIIGTAALVVSFSTIFVAASNLGVATGVQRFLGISFAEKKLSNAKVEVKAALLLISIGISASSILLLISHKLVEASFGLDLGFIIIAIIIIASTCSFRVLRAVAIASLQTKWLPIILIISTGGKIGLGIILLLMGLGALGVVIGFTISGLLSSILLAFNLFIFFKNTSMKYELSLYTSLKQIYTASTPTWIPNLITRVGSQLGTIVIFGTQGASKAGVFFITLAVTNGIISVMLVLLTIALPVISGMTDGRKRFAWRMTKMSLILAVPISIAIIFFAKDILSIFGNSYIEGTLALQILLVSVLPVGITTGIRNLVYAYGNYRQVLTIGLLISIPRIVLYFVLVPFYGDVGAAIAFTIGSLLGYAGSIFIAHKVGMQVHWKVQSLIICVPISFSFVLSYFEVHAALGIIVSIAFSYLIFLKLGLISRADLKDSVDVLPNKIGSPLLNFLTILVNKLNNSKKFDK